MPYKYHFFDDYSEGAHPRILEALLQTNLAQERGYGEDSLSLEAARLIRERIKNEEAGVHFVSGGTQANLAALASMLKPYESVIATDSAHVSLHEAGAIEATGHKVHLVQSWDGRLTADAVREVVAQHTDEHMVKPKVVFISQATELGTVYQKRELEEIVQACKELNLYLYLDGARLGAALACSEADLGLSDLAKLLDVFSIGGTKNGALLGEAIVIVNPALQEHFRHHLKQRGALLAKGRALSAQFAELFKDDLFFELARHANVLATKLSQGIAVLGYVFLVPSVTNQIFPILPNKIIEQLRTQYGFYVWAKADPGHSAIRLVTSWATTEEAVNEFLEDLRKIY